MADSKSIPDGWKNRPEYTLDEAVKLWAVVLYGRGFDDHWKTHPGYAGALQAAKTDLLNAGIVHEIEINPTPERTDRNDTRVIKQLPTFTKRWVNGPDLAALLAERGKPGVIGFGEEKQAIESNCLPCNHDTILLNAVRWVIENYWERGINHPKAFVVEKLMKIRGLSKNEAEAVDLVTRPDAVRRRAPSEVPT